MAMTFERLTSLNGVRMAAVCWARTRFWAMRLRILLIGTRLVPSGPKSMLPPLPGGRGLGVVAVPERATGAAGDDGAAVGAGGASRPSGPPLVSPSRDSRWWVTS